MNPPLRLAIFGSFLRGSALIGEALALQKSHPEKIALVGIATDNPADRRILPHRRVWQYVPAPADREMVANLARAHGIAPWLDSIKTEEFRTRFEAEWRPDVCYMGTFGQLIPATLFSRPPLGFYNLHPCKPGTWPSYVGGNPFQAMLQAGERSGAVALHEVNEKWDDGRLVAFSRSYAIADGDDVVELHRRSSPEAAWLMGWHLRGLLGLQAESDDPQAAESAATACASVGNVA